MSPQATSHNPETQVYTCQTKLAAIVERFGTVAAMQDSDSDEDMLFMLDEEECMRVAA